MTKEKLNDRLWTVGIMLIVGLCSAYFVDLFDDKNNIQAQDTHEFELLESKVNDKLDKKDFAIYKTEHQIKHETEAKHEESIRELLIREFDNINRRLDNIEK